MLEDNGETRAAEAAYREGTKKAPEFAGNFFDLAFFLHDRNDLATAERAARAGLRLEATRADIASLGISSIRRATQRA